MMHMNTDTMIALGALLVAFATFLATGRRDARGSAADQARLQEQLGGIRSGVDDIRLEMRSMRKDMAQHGEKLVELEASCKSAHKRLDDHIRETTREKE